MSRHAGARRRDGWRATRLSNEAFTLLALGQAAKALPLAAEALDIARALAAASPGRHQDSLARALVIAAGAMQETGHDDEAFQLTGQAVEIYRALPPAKDRAYRARAAHQMAVGLARRRRWTEALPFDEEAVGIYRQLAAASGGGNFAPLLGSATTALLVHVYALGEGAREWSIELQRRDPALCMQLDQTTAALDENPAVFLQACERFGGPPDLPAPLVPVLAGQAFELRHGCTVAAKRSSFPVRVSFHTRWKAPVLAVMPW
jgi:tetratricopeptide (TPR) repeat protein